MDAEDRPVFEQAFQRLTGAFRLKLKPVQLEDLGRIYFKAFDGIDLQVVLAAGKVCLEKSKKFPTVADWLQALPSAASPETPDLRGMGHDELVEYHRAERLHYQDEPCACLFCQAAMTIPRPLRFVPDFLEDGRTDRAFDPERNRIVVVGHWAHGEELVRWYAARAACMLSAPRSSPLARAVAVLVGEEREPGMEG